MIAQQTAVRERNALTNNHYKVPFLIGIYILFLIALLLALKSMDAASNAVWLLVIFSVLLYDCVAKPRKTAWQHLILTAGILFVWLTQIPMSAGTISSFSAQLIKYVGTGIWGFHFLYLCLLAFTSRKGKSGKKFKSFFARNCVPFLISIIYIVSSLSTLRLWFKSDGYTYYSSVVDGIGKWDFTLNTLNAFTMGGHVSYGYAPFLQGGLFLAEPYGIGIRIVNLLFSVITIFSFHYIVLFLFPTYRKKRETVKLFFAESVFSLCPLFLGISYEVYTDYAMFFYFVWMVACFVYRLDVLGVACAVLLCFSKEFGIFILAGCLGAYGVTIIVKQRKRLEIIISEAKRCSVYCIGVIPFLLSLLCGDAGWGKSAKQTLSSNQNIEGRIPSSLVFDPDYILVKLKEIFVLHYAWLFCAVFVILLICALRIGMKKATGTIQENVMAIAGAFVVFTALQLFYLTYVHYRYLQLYTFLGALLLAWVASNVSLSYVLTGPLAIFLLVESFITTDPVSLYLFNTINVGSGNNISTIKYVYIDHALDNDEDDGTFFTAEETPDVWDHVLLDGMMNNRDQIGIERTTEQAMKKISYTDNDAVILSPIYHGLSVFSLWGRLDLDSYYWNSQSGQITNNSKDQKIHLLSHGAVENNEKKILREYDNVYYFNYPFINNQYEDDSEERVEEFLLDYDFEFVEEIRYGKWTLQVYRLRS